VPTFFSYCYESQGCLYQETRCQQPVLNHDEEVRKVRVAWTGPFQEGICNPTQKITWYLIGHAARHLIAWAHRILSQISHTSALKYRRAFSCDSTMWHVWDEIENSSYAPKRIAESSQSNILCNTQGHFRLHRSKQQAWDNKKSYTLVHAKIIFYWFKLVLFNVNFTVVQVTWMNMKRWQ